MAEARLLNSGGYIMYGAGSYCIVNLRSSVCIGEAHGGQGFPPSQGSEANCSLTLFTTQNALIAAI